MAFAFRLSIAGSDGTETEITIEDSINPLPGSDSWTASDRTAFDCAGGAVSNWGQSEADLTGPVGARSMVLNGFSSNTQTGAENNGQKNYDGGTIPLGDIQWVCLKGRTKKLSMNKKRK